MKFQDLYKLIEETRFSDREYYNRHAAWKLTLDQYLKISNKGQKWHPSSAYSPRDITVLDDDPNPPVEVNVRPNRDDPRWVDVEWKLKDGTYGYQSRRSPMEVSNEKDKFKFAQNWSNSDKKYKTIKDKYWYAMADGYTIEKFPIKITSKDGIDYRIRKEKARYSKKDKDGEYLRDENQRIIDYTDEEIKHKKLKSSIVTVAAFDGDEIVGMAADEWGAYLVTVNPSHRGLGIGATLAHIFLSIYPKKDSGGYTDYGKTMAKAVYKRAVEDAKRLGWYERAVKDGSMKQEKVDKILSSI
jgi:GNAT superfamily N-acetyltransferase